MTRVALGELVDFYSGGTPSKARPEFWSGDVPWFSAKDLKRPRLHDSVDHISQGVFAVTPLRKFPPGTIVIVVRGMILAHTLPVSILEVAGTINQDLKAMVPKTEVDATYLASMLRAQASTILAKVSTAAHGTKKLDARVLEEIEVPYPSLAEQRRIAAILDQVDTLRAKRHQVLDHLDSLTQAIFHDMFGPALPSGRLRDLGVDFVSGKNVVAAGLDSHPRNRVIKVSAISGGSFLASESKPMPRDYEPPESHRVKRGDVLFGRASGSLELLGATAVVDTNPEDLFLPDKVWRLELRPDSPLTKKYVLGVLRSPSARSFVRHNASGAAGVRNIAKAKLLEYMAPVPPRAQQLDFARRIENVEALHAVARRALKYHQQLYASLQSRAFRGEL